MFRTFREDDAYNLGNNRTIKNTPKERYNCGGYALGTFSWYCPYSEEDDDGWFGFHCGYRTREEAWEKTMYLVGFMLNDFCGQLRIIRQLSDLKRHEYAIAFRLSADGDFHYIKQGKNGVWYHKRGASAEIHTMSTDEVLNTRWCRRYGGPVVLLAMSTK